MEFNYLYIDDASKEVMKGTVAGLEERGYLNIKCENPTGSWEEQRESILSRQNEFDGLLLDLRLEDYKNEQNRTSYFKGTTLAQELRTLSKEKTFNEIPIVLLSATANIATSFDSTGFDLFDLIIYKEKLTTGDHLNRKKQLFSLAKGYKQIKASNDSTNEERLKLLLGLEKELIDVRFTQKLTGLFEQTLHELVTFLIREFLEKDGLLIGENTLASRLGVNYEKSPDWNLVKEAFKPYFYSGVFCEGWPMWWANGIDKWWTTALNESTDPMYLSSEERVNIIKSKTNIKEITPIEKGKYSESTLFWNICVKTGRPIDPVDSILAAGQDILYPWQDRLYISKEQALNGPKSDLSPLEWDRVEKFKVFYKRERSRRE